MPVIFVSAYGQDQLVARAFDKGAADYLVKPFSPVELAARIRAALRRRETPEPSQSYAFGDLTINYAERLVSLEGRPVQLTDIEYRTLAELALNAGQVLTYEHLLRRVWRLEGDADVRPMRTAISSLRRKIGDDAETPPTSSPNFALATGCPGGRSGRRRNRRPRRSSRSSIPMRHTTGMASIRCADRLPSHISKMAVSTVNVVG